MPALARLTVVCGLQSRCGYPFRRIRFRRGELPIATQSPFLTRSRWEMRTAVCASSSIMWNRNQREVSAMPFVKYISDGRKHPDVKISVSMNKGTSWTVKSDTMCDGGRSMHRYFIKIFLACIYIISLIFSAETIHASDLSSESHFKMAMFVTRLRAAVYASDYSDYAKLAEWQESLEIPVEASYDERRYLYDYQKSCIEFSTVLKKYYGKEAFLDGFIDGLALDIKALYGIAKLAYNEFVNNKKPEDFRKALKENDRRWSDICSLMSKYGYSEKGLTMLARHFSKNKLNHDGNIQNNIGSSFIEGKDLPYYPGAAIAFYEFAVSKKNATACENLSKLYYFGGFSKKNPNIINYKKSLYYADLALQYNPNNDKFNKYYLYIKNNPPKIK